MKDGQIAIGQIRIKNLKKNSNFKIVYIKGVFWSPKREESIKNTLGAPQSLLHIENALQR